MQVSITSTSTIAVHATQIENVALLLRRETLESKIPGRIGSRGNVVATTMASSSLKRSFVLEISSTAPIRKITGYSAYSHKIRSTLDRDMRGTRLSKLQVEGSQNVGIHHARALGRPSSKAPSRAGVQFFVPDVFGTRQLRLEYSRYTIEAATKFCRSLVSSVKILKPRRSRRARSL